MVNHLNSHSDPACDILGNFLSAFLVLPSLNDDQMADMVKDLIESLPGVEHCSICLRFMEKEVGLSTEESREVMEQLRKAGPEEKHPPIKLENNDGKIVFILKSDERTYGCIIIILKDADVFERVCPNIGKIINIFSIELDNRWQKKDLQEYRLNLLDKVYHRTRQLESEITRRESLEKELENTNNMLLESQIIAGLGSYTLDFATGIWVNSPVIDKIFGIGKNFKRDIEGWLSIVHPEHREEMDNYLKDLQKKKKETFNKQYLIVNQIDKKQRWVHGLGRLEYNSQGELVRMLGTIQDISSHINAEINLKNSKELAESYLDIAAEIILKLETNGTIAQMNTSGHKLLGYYKGGLEGKDWFNTCIPAETRAGVRKLFELIMKGDIANVSTFENPVITSRGELRDILWHNTLLYVDGKISGVLCSGEDITSRKKTERKLRETEEKFTKAFYNHPSAMEMVNLITGERLAHNGKFMNLIEVDQNYNLTSNIYQAKYWRDKAATERAIDKLLKEGFLEETEVEIYTAKGKRKYVIISASLLDISEEKTAIVSLEDITRLKETENSLRKAVQELEEIKAVIEEENVYLQHEIRQQHNFGEIIGKSRIMQKLFKQIQLVAETDSVVLIQGETGTGKELIAREIHNNSKRKNKPLIKVNCPAIPAELIESEFFGSEKGAYTGSTEKKAGRFELADKGTIFLDEIGDLPLGLQVKLLRVLQEGEFERLGSGKSVKVDVRIIAATNRDLDELVQEGKFRQDLYFRLNVFPITSPPLRERKEDIPHLVNYFTKSMNKKMGKNIISLPEKAKEKLMDYHWPGNVRELENVIERAIIYSPGKTLFIGNWFNMTSQPAETTNLIPLADMERDYIMKVLDKTSWRIRGPKGAASILGIKPTTLESRMKKLSITRPGFDLKH